jgi:hypothetical protein
MAKVPHTFGPKTSAKILALVESTHPQGPTEGLIPDDYQTPPNRRRIIKRAVTDSAITAGSTGTVSIWKKNPTTGVLEDTDVDETAYLDWMTAEDISEGKQIVIDWTGSEWLIIGAECEDATPPDVLSGSTTLKAQTLTNDFAEVGGMIETYKSGSAIIAAIAE